MKLHGYFTDGVILSGEKDCRIIGFGESGEKIYAELKGKKAQTRETTVGENGRFVLVFDKVGNGYDPYTLTVRGGKDTVTVNNILFGKLFLAAGQSNMEYPLKYLENEKGLFEEYASPSLRILQIPCKTVCQEEGIFRGAGDALDDICPSVWKTVNDYEKIKELSGFAIVFGGEIEKRIGCPVGIVETSVGGSGIEHWLPEEVIRNDESSIYAFGLERVNGRVSVGCIYDEKIHPLKSLVFDGFLWYQGESSAWLSSSAWEYRHAFMSLIDEYRSYFGEIPVLAIHIGIEKYDRFGVNLVNESINFAARNLPRVAVCPIFDLPHGYFKKDGSEIYHSIHLTTKREAATRAAEIYYNRFIDGNGAECARFCSAKRDKGDILVKFEGVKGTLTVKGSKIIGFTVAGKDRRYVVARAEIVAPDTVRVFSDYCTEPVYATYGFFMYNNNCNLYANGLPVLPFRTDETFEGIDTLIEPPAFTDIISPLAMETVFDTQNGGMRYVPTWVPGKLFGSEKSKVVFLEDCVSLEYDRDDETYYYYTVSPEINIAFGKNFFSEYSFGELEIESSADVVFTGCSVRTCDGDQVTFPAVSGEKKSYKTPVAGGVRTKITIGFASALNYVGQEVGTSAEFRNRICFAQLNFRDFGEEKGRIKIFSFEFHD